MVLPHTIRHILHLAQRALELLHADLAVVVDIQHCPQVLHLVARHLPQHMLQQPPHLCLAQFTAPAAVVFGKLFPELLVLILHELVEAIVELCQLGGGFIRAIAVQPQLAACSEVANALRPGTLPPLAAGGACLHVAVHAARDGIVQVLLAVEHQRL